MCRGMAKSFDTLQALLVEIQEFLNVTLQKEQLTTTAREHRQRILEKIRRFSDNEKPSQELERDHKTDFQNVFEAMRKKSHGHIQNRKENIENEKDGEIILKVATTDILNPNVCGYLSEFSSSITESLSRRATVKLWCVIKQGIFFIFDSKKDFCQRDSFHLTGYGFHKVPNLIKAQDKKPLAFELRAQGKKTYCFIAESLHEFCGWRDVIEVSKRTSKIGIAEVVHEGPAKKKPEKLEKDKTENREIDLPDKREKEIQDKREKDKSDKREKDKPDKREKDKPDKREKDKPDKFQTENKIIDDENGIVEIVHETPAKKKPGKLEKDKTENREIDLPDKREQEIQDKREIDKPDKREKDKPDKFQTENKIVDDENGIVEVVHETPAKKNPEKLEKDKTENRGKKHEKITDNRKKVNPDIVETQNEINDDENYYVDLNFVAEMDDSYYDVIRDNQTRAATYVNIPNDIPTEQAPTPPALPDRGEYEQSNKTPRTKSKGAKFSFFKRKKSLSTQNKGSADDYGNMYIALKRYTAMKEIELSFKEGDEIKLMWIDSNDDTWFGMLNGKIGMVNRKYLSLS